MFIDEVKTPCYVIDEDLIEKNLKILKDVMDRTGCKNTLSTKGIQRIRPLSLDIKIPLRLCCKRNIRGKAVPYQDAEQGKPHLFAGVQG